MSEFGGSSNGSRLIGDLPGRQGQRPMYYTYVLISEKNKRLYVGSTDNLKRRVEEHNKGVGGEYTSNNRPFKLLFYEAFISKLDAQKQEKFYKTGYGREVLHGKIVSSLKEVFE